MTEQLYFVDAYLKECKATILHVSSLDNRWIAITLDKTVLQPSHRDGGDKGVLETENYGIIRVEKVVMDQTLNRIDHRSRFAGIIPSGTEAKCKVDWDRRYRLMRKHTANHLIYGCGKLLSRTNFPALSNTTLGDTYTQWIGQANSVDERLIKEVFEMANTIICESRNVVIETLPRQKALEKCGKYLDPILPRSLAELRVVTIENLDSNPCIGLHVRNIKEIKKIKLVKVMREGNDIKIFSDVE